MKATAFFIVPSLLGSLTSAAPIPFNLPFTQGNQNSQPSDKGLLSGFNLKNLGNVLAKANPSPQAVASAPSYSQTTAALRTPSWSAIRDCGKPHQLCRGNAYVWNYNMKQNQRPTACEWKNFDGAKQRIVALPLRYMGPESYPNPLCGAAVTIKYGNKVVTAPVGDKHGELIDGFPEDLPAGSEHDIYISPAVAEDLDIDLDGPDAKALQGITWSINPNEKIRKVVGDHVAEAARVNVPPLADPALNIKSSRTPPPTRQMPNLGSTDPVEPQRLPSASRQSSKSPDTRPATPQAGITPPPSGTVVTGSMVDSLEDDDTDMVGTPGTNSPKPGQSAYGSVKTQPVDTLAIPKKAVPISREIPYPNLDNDTPWGASTSQTKNNLQLASVPAALNKAAGKGASWLDGLVRGA